MAIISAELYKNILNETGVSFIYGITTASIKGILQNKTNIIHKQVQALRKAAENARFTFLYNTVVHLLLKMHMKTLFANAFAFFISSYVVGLRNGMAFGLKNGIFGFFLTLFNKCIN